LVMKCMFFSLIPLPGQKIFEIGVTPIAFPPLLSIQLVGSVNLYICFLFDSTARPKDFEIGVTPIPVLYVFSLIPGQKIFEIGVTPIAFPPLVSIQLVG